MGKKHKAHKLPTVHFTMDEDATLLIQDSDLISQANIDSNQPLQVLGLANPQGTLINNNNGTWSFTPPKYFTGTVTLDCIISDGAHQATQKIKIEVQHVAVGMQYPEVELLMQEDGSFLIATKQLLQTTTDIEGETLDIVEMSAPQGDFYNNLDSTWTFIPNAEYFGTIDLQFSVTDGQETVTQYLVITVNAPILMPEIDYVLNENTALTFTSEDLLETADNVEGDLLEIIDIKPQVGQIINNDNGTWTYLPPENYVGPLCLQFGITDTSGAVVDQQINIYAISENLATQEPKVLLMQPDGTVIIPLYILLEDSPEEVDYLVFADLASTHGSIQQIGSKNNPKWLFTPNDSFEDNIELQYTIDDGRNKTAHFINIEVVKNLQ